LVADRSGDAPDETQLVEKRLEQGQRLEGRQHPGRQSLDQLLRAHSTQHPAHLQRGGEALIAAGTAHAHRNLPAGYQRTADHHRLASGEHLPHPGRRVGGQLCRCQAPEQVVGA